MKNLLRILFLILCLFVQTQNLLYAQQPIQRLEKNTSAGVGELFGDSGVKSISTNYPISEIIHITTPPPGKIIIKGNADSGNNNHSGAGKKSTQELPAGQDYTIIDSNGNIWAVDENGNITQNGKLAEGGASNTDNTNGVDSNGLATTITANHPNYNNYIDQKIDNIVLNNKGDLEASFDDFLEFTQDLKKRINIEVIKGDNIINNISIK
ncbi:hypothetical protein [Bergeyella zoohelcum]|uniref:Uncharacterized protein n=1 Tax=Bergeyella zoohelcum ATCC 43767 TaxID=883096 RepID=K1LY59_9FLAO|nr:hypothetical protein [Bergeyella zoohelcum]EKB57007.1 hypothetical protein HMPREF9699_01129 [Bergeyella zoohelcum ATCC 43767]SUV48688.1 Uncharacterised protein [Bergeyella zoohelcum]